VGLIAFAGAIPAQPTGMPVALKSLRKFRRFQRFPPFTVYMIAVAGWFFSFGLQTTLFPGVINYTLNESPDRLGLAQAALTAPMLFLLPMAGVVAERLDRRWVMGGFHLLACLCAGLMSLLLFQNLLSYWVMILYALLVGVAGAFVMPARDSAVNAVTRVAQRLGRRDFTLQKAVILASLVQFAAQIFGMGAGVLAGRLGPAPLFAVQAGGLAIGAGAALLMPRLPRQNTGGESLWTSLRTGVLEVVRSPILAPMTLIMLALGLLVVGGGFFVIIPVLVRDVYDGGYGLLALLLVSFWIGAFIANVLLSQVGEIERPGRILMLAQLVTVVSMGLLALPLPLYALFILVFSWGLGGGVGISLSRAVVQENAPPRMIARVMSVYQLGMFGGMPLGAFVMGYVVHEIGPRLSSLIPMAGLLLVLIVIALTTPILALRRVR